ncbi:CAP domain-containing protein [Streptomyces sp. T-3]|nr:CAP domain-containing protein [Streptomyces sp. T-3]
MHELTAGGNLPLPDGPLTLRVPGPFDLSLLVTGDDGKVDGDGDFVFFNQPTAPGAHLQNDTLTLDPGRLRAGATRVTVVISPADPGAGLGRLPAPTLTVTGSGTPLARFTPAPPQGETVLLLAEIYRRGAAWKVRALGQGYADGLAGVARDFGVDVTEEEPSGPVPSAPAAPTVDADGVAALINSRRSRLSCPPISVDARLQSAAQTHADAMAHGGRLTAETPDGVSIYQRVTTGGYGYLLLAEQLVSGPRTPAEFLDYCQSDAGTRRPLADPTVADAALAHATDSRTGDTYWTALWARPFTAPGLSALTAEVLTLTNAERTRAGLRPFAPDTALTAGAQGHSGDMIARDFYAHTSPDGREPWDRARTAGSAHRAIGENIACGQRTPAEVVQGWMNSPGHRANILKPDFTHLGVGFAGGGRAGTYWTQLFGGS